MNRICFLIDGFNFYHSLNDPYRTNYGINPPVRIYLYRKYKWLNYKKFASLFLRKNETISDVLFFSAYSTWNMVKRRRHENYVKALEMEGIKFIKGKFKMRDKTCRICNRKYEIPEEKQTDVNIAVKLFEGAINNSYDTVIIVSGDSDLVPAIKGVKESFPQKRIGVIIPIKRFARELIQVSDFHYKTKERHLKTSQFPDKITLPNGYVLERPQTQTWK